MLWMQESGVISSGSSCVYWECVYGSEVGLRLAAVSLKLLRESLQCQWLHTVHLNISYLTAGLPYSYSDALC